MSKRTLIGGLMLSLVLVLAVSAQRTQSEGSTTPGTRCGFTSSVASLVTMPHQTPNQSVELTATRRTLTFQMTRTSSLRAPRALGGGSSLPSR